MPGIEVAAFRPGIIVIFLKIPAICIVNVTVMVVVDTVMDVDRVGKNIAGELGERGINAIAEDDYHHHA
jgi:hypothetical protein